MTVTDELFPLTNVTYNSSCIVVFGTVVSLKRLGQNEVLYMDCTFYQPYSIQPDHYPEVYCFLPDKHTHTYEKLFKILKDKLLLHKFVFSLTAIMADFELAVHKAVCSVFCTTGIWSCLFHFGQALHGTYTVRSQLNKYQQDSYIWCIIKCV